MDILSLLLLRPLSACVLMYMLYRYGQQIWREYRTVSLVLLTVVGGILVQLVPLPPGIWTALPGRAIIVAGFDAAGVALPWLPLSLVPATTWNALFFMMGPFAILIGVLFQPRKTQTILFYALLLLLLTSGVLALLQTLGPPRGPLYFYRLTNTGSAVGLFANRNHNAIALACMFPMLVGGLFIGGGSAQNGDRSKLVIACGISLYAITLILITGSRMGLVAGALGLSFAVWIYISLAKFNSRKPRHRSKIWMWLGAALPVFALVAYTQFESRAFSVQRLLVEDQGQDLRITALPTIWEATKAFFPLGSGFGTFVQTFQIFEPDHFLSGEYFNHAHNDYVELLMTGGVAGAIAILIVIVFMLRASYGLWQSRNNGDPIELATLSRVGIAILFLLMAGSVTDYPVRTPALAGLTAVCIGWVVVGWRKLELGAIEKH